MKQLIDNVNLWEQALSNLLEYKKNYVSRCLAEKKDKKYIAVLEREIEVIEQFQLSCYALIKELNNEKKHYPGSSEIKTYAQYSAYLSRNWANIKRFEHKKI